MSKQRAKGTALETLIVNYLATRLGDDRIMRMPLHGKADRGDIAGIRTVMGERVVVEVKNHKKMQLGVWLTEAETSAPSSTAKSATVIVIN